MKDIENEYNSQKDVNKDNQNDFPNVNNSESNQNEENNSNDKIKLGEYMLTPLESILLNQKMPSGFKFETEENIIKSVEQAKIILKRAKDKEKEKEKNNHGNTKKNLINGDRSLNKKNNSIKEHSSNNNNDNSKKIKKIVTKENISNNNKSNNSESYKIMMKCYSGLNKIKSNQKSNFFYYSKNPDAPSLSQIEKKIKNFEYKTVTAFCDDLRKLWNYQFKNYAKDPNIYQNICKMSSLSDQICKEISNDNII